MRTSYYSLGLDFAKNLNTTLIIFSLVTWIIFNRLIHSTYDIDCAAKQRNTDAQKKNRFLINS